MLPYNVPGPHSFKKGAPMSRILKYQSHLGNCLPDPLFYSNVCRSPGSGNRKLSLKDTGLALEKWHDTGRGRLTLDRGFVLSAPL